MSMKTKLMRTFAFGAFAVALVSAPFMTTAKADWDERGNRYGYWVEQQQDRAHAHRRLHKAEKRHHHLHKAERHHRHDQIRKHRRIRQAWNAKHDYRAKAPVKIVYRVVNVQPAPRHDPRERLVASIIEAVFAANIANYYR